MQFHACAVVGLPHQRRARYIIKRVRPGATLTLRREPDNPDDSEAIAVCHDGRKIGYIPSPQRWLCQSIADGDPGRVTVKDLIYGEDGTLLRIDVAIAMIADDSGDRIWAPNRVVSLIGDELRILAAVAKLSGRFETGAPALLAKFAEVRCGELALSVEADDLAAAMRWLEHNIPGGGNIASTIDSLKNPGAFDAMIEVSEIIAEAGGPLGAEEQAGVMKIRSLIAERRAKAAA